jgi:hypothetical protein
VAIVWAWHFTMAWKMDASDRISEIWKRLAFATRYGRAGLGEAMALPIDDLTSYISAVAEIMSEEKASIADMI